MRRLTYLVLVCIVSTTAALAQVRSGWSDGDIGTVGISGSSSYSSGTFTITGAGYGTGTTTADGINFMAQALSGDVTIVARINSLSGYNSAAGLMIRESLDPD